MKAARDDPLTTELLAARRAGRLSAEGYDLLAEKVGRAAADILQAELSRPKSKREVKEIIRERFRELRHQGRSVDQARFVLFDEGFNVRLVNRVLEKGLD